MDMLSFVQKSNFISSNPGIITWSYSFSTLSLSVGIFSIHPLMSKTMRNQSDVRIKIYLEYK